MVPLLNESGITGWIHIEIKTGYIENIHDLLAMGL